ncbi:MAG: FAD:protein FMN transferase [Bacteroidota bacterium]
MKYYTILFLITLTLLSCEAPKTDQNSSEETAVIQGEAQGTTYSIKYTGENTVNKSQIDSLLREIDFSLSAWVDESTLTSFNNSDSISVSDSHFLSVFYRSKEIFEVTDGDFQPMIMPLTSAWGFGPDGGELKDGLNLDSVRKLVTFEIKTIPNENSQSVTFLKNENSQLDVNGIAQGYSVDVLGEFLEREGITNYMVEVGGELRAKGKNEKGEYWRIGVDKPSSTVSNRTLQAILTLKNASLATSGSYRKFYEKDGRKYSHTIDPKTGEPVNHNLLSVTVLASSCTSADAFATAFMVKGVEGTKNFLIQHPELELGVFIIYDDDGEVKTYASQELTGILEEV